MRAAWFVFLAACELPDVEGGEPVPLEVRVMDLRYGTPLEGEVCIDGTCATTSEAIAILEVDGSQRLVVEVTPAGDYVPVLLALSPAAGERRVVAAAMGRVWAASIGSAVDAVNDGTAGTVRFAVTDAVGAPIGGATAELSEAVGTGPIYVESDGVRVADGASATTNAGWGLWYDVPVGDGLVLTIDHTGDCDAAGGWTGEEIGDVDLALAAGFQSQVDVVCP